MLLLPWLSFAGIPQAQADLAHAFATVVVGFAAADAGFAKITAIDLRPLEWAQMITTVATTVAAIASWRAASAARATAQASKDMEESARKRELLQLLSTVSSKAHAVAGLAEQLESRWKGIFAQRGAHGGSADEAKQKSLATHRE